MSTISLEALPSNNSELLFNPKELIRMQMTARAVSNLLQTDDEDSRDAFRQSLLSSFITVEETRQKMPAAEFNEIAGKLDRRKDISEELIARYAWYCGYESKWNANNVLKLTSRF